MHATFSNIPSFSSQLFDQEKMNNGWNWLGARICAIVNFAGFFYVSLLCNCLTSLTMTKDKENE